MGYGGGRRCRALSRELREVMHGNVGLPREVTHHVVRKLRQAIRVVANSGSHATQSLLTPRQRNILISIQQSHRTRAIANRLGITEASVVKQLAQGVSRLSRAYTSPMPSPRPALLIPVGRRAERSRWHVPVEHHHMMKYGQIECMLCRCPAAPLGGLLTRDRRKPRHSLGCLAH
jgi:DNA-binding CsgD family transcriptional regulator